MKTIILKKQDRGFILMFTVLVATLMLTIVTGIMATATRQIQLNSIGREGYTAFAAADMGMECALLFDKKLDRFNVNAPFPSEVCGNKTFGINATETVTPFTHFSFEGAVPLSEEKKVFISVSVNKDFRELVGTEYVSYTRIEVNGYNKESLTNKQGLVERRLIYSYINPS